MFIARQQSAGYFFWLPIGLKLQSTITSIIIQYNTKLGLQVKCSSVATKDIYSQSGRLSIFEEEVIQFTNRHNTGMLLSPTCEESFITYLLENKLSYKNFPIYCFQIGTKYRDEIRPRNNILRACEFCMKDGYGFFASAEQMTTFYAELRAIYIQIFQYLGVAVDIIPADSTSMLGLNSEEFMNENTTSESKYQVLDQTKNGIEMAHIFNLGTQYSIAANKLFIDSNNAMANIYMGSYGIGVDRLVYVISQKILNKEQLPKELDIFSVILIPKNKGSHLHTIYEQIPNTILDDLYSISYADRIEFAQQIGGKNIIIEHQNTYSIMHHNTKNITSLGNNTTSLPMLEQILDALIS